MAITPLATSRHRTSHHAFQAPASGRKRVNFADRRHQAMVRIDPARGTVVVGAVNRHAPCPALPRRRIGALDQKRQPLTVPACNAVRGRPLQLVQPFAFVGRHRKKVAVGADDGVGVKRHSAYIFQAEILLCLAPINCCGLAN